MPRKPKPGMAWLHNIELSENAIQALEEYCQNTGASRRDALEYALSSLPTFTGILEIPSWADKIQKFIDNKQPFILNYRDASDRAFSWTVRYAEFKFREKRNYLEFWAEETQNNQDIEPLRHNWCVRLDRIVSVEIDPTNGEWREGLDTVEVEFCLYNGLSYAYAKETNGVKPDDLSSERLDANTKKIVRRINNTFWFIREVVRYLDDCQVLSPPSIREMVLEKATRLINRYRR